MKKLIKEKTDIELKRLLFTDIKKVTSRETYLSLEKHSSAYWQELMSLKEELTIFDVLDIVATVLVTEMMSKKEFSLFCDQLKQELENKKKGT